MPCVAHHVFMPCSLRRLVTTNDSFLSAGQFSHTLYMGEDKERKVSMVLDSLLVRRWTCSCQFCASLTTCVADANQACGLLGGALCCRLQCPCASWYDAQL